MGLLRDSSSSTCSQRSRRRCRDCVQCNSSCSQRSCCCRYCPNRCGSTRSLRALSPLRAATDAAAVDAAQHAIAVPNTRLLLRGAFHRRWRSRLGRAMDHSSTAPLLSRCPFMHHNLLQPSWLGLLTLQRRTLHRRTMTAGGSVVSSRCGGAALVCRYEFPTIYEKHEPRTREGHFWAPPRLIFSERAVQPPRVVGLGARSAESTRRGGAAAGRRSADRARNRWGERSEPA